MKQLAFLFLTFLWFGFAQSQTLDLPLTGTYNIKKIKITEGVNETVTKPEGTLVIDKILAINIKGQKEVKLDLEAIIEEQGLKVTQEKQPIGTEGDYSYNLFMISEDAKSTMGLVLISMKEKSGGSFTITEYKGAEKVTTQLSF
jgi:hypothetical protein